MDDEAMKEYKTYSPEYRKWWETEAYWVYVEKTDILHHFDKIVGAQVEEKKASKTYELWFKL